MSAEQTAEPAALHLFEGYGIEIEYAIVDRADLSVRPLADRLIEAESGAVENEIERGPMAWSNELALHVVEFKTNGPVARLQGVAELFEAEVRRADAHLARLGARLMPTGMHPWMDPEREFALWPHGDRQIYETFHRIFDCRGHGWANLQSMHLNLAFADDAEFRRLHDAVRRVLPLLPALAASSPLRDGRVTGLLDTRLEVYRGNARRVPSVSGQVVPEPVTDRASYERTILERIYADLAPLDPDGVLRHEWVNARGAIARFDRGAIEIRVLDTQECPRADLAVAAAAAAAIRQLTERAEAEALPDAPPTGRLAALLAETGRWGGDARVEDTALLRALGLPPRALPAREVWRALLDAPLGRDDFAEWRAPLERILAQGCLARRILRRLGDDPRPDALRAVYAELCDCLLEGRLLDAPD